MPKDGCNNMEKNKILRLHKAGNDVPSIAKHLRLTERIVQKMIDHYTKPEAEAKPKSKPKKKKAKKKVETEPEAAEEFEDDFN